VGEEGVEGAFAEDAAEFAEGEEGQQAAEDDDGAGDHPVELDLVEGGAGGFVTDEAFDELLEEVDGEDEEREEDGFEEHRLVEGAAFDASADVHHLADEDDLANDHGVDDGEAEVHQVGVVAVQEQVAVGDEGAEEEGEIAGGYGVVDHLALGLLLEGGFCGGGLAGADQLAHGSLLCLQTGYCFAGVMGGGLLGDADLLDGGGFNRTFVPRGCD
jgi:hypothetical protein